MQAVVLGRNERSSGVWEEEERRDGFVIFGRGKLGPWGGPRRRMGMARDLSTGTHGTREEKKTEEKKKKRRRRGSGTRRILEYKIRGGSARQVYAGVFFIFIFYYFIFPGTRWDAAFSRWRSTPVAVTALVRGYSRGTRRTAPVAGETFWLRATRRSTQRGYEGDLGAEKNSEG